MAPPQLSRQCRDNLFVREQLGELHHAPQIFLGKTFSILCGQLLCQQGDSFFAIARALSTHYLSLYAMTNIPVEQCDFTIDREDRTFTGCFDQLADVT